MTPRWERKLFVIDVRDFVEGKAKNTKLIRIVVGHNTPL
jgi:hypothetical protein